MWREAELLSGLLMQGVGSEPAGDDAREQEFPFHLWKAGWDLIDILSLKMRKDGGEWDQSWTGDSTVHCTPPSTNSTQTSSKVEVT